MERQRQFYFVKTEIKVGNAELKEIIIYTFVASIGSFVL